METLDYKVDLKEYYKASKKEPVIIDVPAFPFFLVNGTGDPNTSEHFQGAVKTLFTLSYTLKFAVKKAGILDYKVMPLTGYWTLVDPKDRDISNRENWAWTVGIQQPEAVDLEMIALARESVRKKKPEAILDEVRYETVADGLCAQILHVGPFAEENATFDRMHEFLEASGCRPREEGHREIYLSDFNRTAPEKLKTILRKRLEKV